MQRYAEYKDSGVDWLGKVPTGWELQRNKFIFEEKTKVVGKNAKKFKLLSLTLGGVIPRDMENPKGKFPAEFNTYKQVSENDLVFCLFDVEETPRAVGIAGESGMITGAYTVLKTNPDTNPSFVNYFYLSLDDEKQLKSLYTGLRNVIKIDTFMSMKTPFPDIDIQTAIAKFLDDKTAKIDELVKIKRRQIELLAERKQILIQNAVTKGLNPNAPMKDSGIDWIGEIPAHWEVKPAKHLFVEVDERSENGDEELLSVSHMTGVTPRSEKTVNMFLAEDYSGSKICAEGDLVYNIMWAWMGALGVSAQLGIVSPSYAVFRQLKSQTFNPVYLEVLMQSLGYIKHYNKVSTGLHSSRLRFYSYMFLSMKIGYPSFEEQERIVQFLNKETGKISKAMSVLENQIIKLNEYKTTLINAAVTGKIKVI